MNIFKIKMYSYKFVLFFKGIDFPTVDSGVDYYVITFNFINQNCTSDLRRTGIAPLDGPAKYTLVRQNR